MEKDIMITRIKKEIKSLYFSRELGLVSTEEHDESINLLKEKIEKIKKGEITDLKEEVTKGRYRLEVVVPGCIACGACAKMNPLDWLWDENLKTELRGGEKKFAENDSLIKEVKHTDELRNNLEVAEICPVHVIHVFDEEKDEKLR